MGTLKSTGLAVLKLQATKNEYKFISIYYVNNLRGRKFELLLSSVVILRFIPACS